MKPILVLGDSGLLGQALVNCGKQLGLPVRGASRHSADLPLDALNQLALDRILDEQRPEVIINAAGLIDINRCEQHPDEAWQANARLPAVLSTACATRQIRLVQLSTDHYFTGDGASPHAEDASVKLVNEYARSKYAGECLALTHPDTLVVRTNIVGFRGWKNAPTFVEWLLESLAQRLPIQLFTDFHTSSIAASQCAELLFRLLQLPVTGIVNLASRQGTSKLKFAEALAAACGLSTEACRPGSVTALSGPRRAESLVLDVTRAETWLGEPLPDLSAVVQRLAFEYRERKEKMRCATHR